MEVGLRYPRLTLFLFGHKISKVHVIRRRIVFLEKLIVAQLVKRFVASYGTQLFITVFAKAHDWILSQAR
jgi:hypothetical protein